MRKLAELVRALATLSKVRTLADVLLETVDAGLTVPEHSKITANTLATPYMHVGVETVCACATTGIRKVHAKRRAVRVRVMGERTSFSGVRAVVLEVRPAYCDLGWVVFVDACKATIARTCHEEGMWLKGTKNRFSNEDLRFVGAHRW